MSQTVRVNTRSAEFPLLSRDFGRSIIQETLDTHNPGLPGYTGQQSQQNTGIPQVTYMENVLPTAYGYKSVCYEEGTIPCAVDFGSCEINHLVKDRYVKHDGQITIANLHNKGFLFDSNNKKLYQVFPDCGIEEIALDCINWDDIIGITTVAGRLVAYSTCRIFWGSLEVGDEHNFCSGLSGLAGAANPTHLKGNIVGILPLMEGAIVYSDENALFMSFNRQSHSGWS